MKTFLIKTKGAGFTLVEIIMVIVILGVLSAFVIPRLFDFSDDSEESVVEGFYASFRFGLAIHRANWHASGQQAVLSGYSGVANSNGALTGNADDGIAHESDCVLIWQDILDTSEELAFVSSSNGFSAGFSGDIWGRNASRIGSLGEAQDVYCHYIYVTSEGNPDVIRYNIATGELDQVVWPFLP